MGSLIFGPYSPVRHVGDLYFASGQVGIHPSTKQAAVNITGQTQQLFKNMQAVLSEVNLTFNDVIKTTVFLKNMDDFAAMNEVYLTYFAVPRPARSCVEVARLPQLADNELLIEIEAIAYKPDDQK